MTNTTGTMKSLENKETEMLQFEHLTADCNISDFVTTRHGGVSRGTYASLNAGFYSGDDPAIVRENRKRLCRALQLPENRLFAPYQVHGSKIRVIDADFLCQSEDEQTVLLEGVDAVVTDIPGIAIAVTTADCVPILLVDPVKKVIAAIHAGWRGTVLQIAGLTARCLIDQYGCNPQAIRAGIAPCISQKAFETGDEVVEAFQAAGLPTVQIARRNPETSKYHIDLPEANRLQLMDAGILSSRIELSNRCTYHEQETFFSARRLGIKSGRFLSGLFIQK